MCLNYWSVKTLINYAINVKIWNNSKPELWLETGSVYNFVIFKFILPRYYCNTNAPYVSQSPVPEGWSRLHHGVQYDAAWPKIKENINYDEYVTVIWKVDQIYYIHYLMEQWDQLNMHLYARESLQRTETETTESGMETTETGNDRVIRRRFSISF